MKKMRNKRPKEKSDAFVFFGSSDFSVKILEILKGSALLPTLIVTTPAKPKGRKLRISETPVGVWAKKEHIPALAPETLESEAVMEVLTVTNASFFVVASYGKILPKQVLDLPQNGTLNVHPSLLPTLRGPSPIESAIVTENETGVSIILLDTQMDHGPILAKEKVDIPNFPVSARSLEDILAQAGGALLVRSIHAWIAGEIIPKEQQHTEATYTEKLEKKDALIDFSRPAHENYRKILAYEHLNPHFFEHVGERKMRIIIKKAHLEKGVLKIETVLPEGRGELSFAEFQKWKTDCNITS